MKHSSYLSLSKKDIIRLLQSEKLHGAKGYFASKKDGKVCGVCAVGALVMEAGHNPELDLQFADTCMDLCKDLVDSTEYRYHIEEAVDADNYLGALSMTFEYFLDLNDLETARKKCIELVEECFPEYVNIPMPEMTFSEV